MIFLGYEGVPDFFVHVTKLLKETIDQSLVANSLTANRTEEDSGIDTGDSSDEKRHQDPNQTLRVKRSTLNLGS